MKSINQTDKSNGTHTKQKKLAYVLTDTGYF